MRRATLIIPSLLPCRDVDCKAAAAQIPLPYAFAPVPVSESHVIPLPHASAPVSVSESHAGSGPEKVPASMLMTVPSSLPPPPARGTCLTKQSASVSHAFTALLAHLAHRSLHRTPSVSTEARRTETA